MPSIDLVRQYLDEGSNLQKPGQGPCPPYLPGHSPYQAWPLGIPLSWRGCLPVLLERRWGEGYQARLRNFFSPRPKCGPPLPALAPREVPAQGVLWTCYRGRGTAGFGVRRATLGGRDITTLSFSVWGDGRDIYLSGWLKMASTVILSMPFVTQSRLESKRGVVQRTGLSCFLCPRPPLTVEAAVLKCLEGWPGQLYKHLLSSQHMPCPGLGSSDEQ